MPDQIDEFKYLLAHKIHQSCGGIQHQ